MSQLLILVNALYLHDGGRRREGKRKKKKEREVAMGEEGFLGAGLSLLAVLWFTAVRCN
jgi:hypothetical protein